MNLVLRRNLLDRLVAPQRFQRHPRLEICREPASCYHRRTPPLSGGIHLSNLSDFPGPVHNHQNWLSKKGKEDEATKNLIIASECNEVGFGLSKSRKGKRFGNKTAREILKIFQLVPNLSEHGFTHFEEIQLYVDNISRDRISDITCNFLKSFLIDYTIENCQKLDIPIEKTEIKNIYDYKSNKFVESEIVDLPINPIDKLPILLVPKRWLRFVPWINFDDYFKTACPKDDVVNAQGSDERVQVLLYNRSNHGLVSHYIEAKERKAHECVNDPLFSQIPVLSAKRKLAEIKAIPTGNKDKADKRFEKATESLLTSTLYPHFDFAASQSRSDGGATIRDLIFYNNRSYDFLNEILDDYGSRQIVFELKNVKKLSGNTSIS